ncbi:hypothetical protein Y032_0349g3196 [Ancylostoma ceylanicum]|uniref:Uncharacterized protein n=1 Tax=Ancylostoma ceylanicum TaxID=53326 RepID=A0A016RXX9_9BILA|nr:hypothetical protein Y032_0349g3196 [Ancylostoma ceylanicum]
MRSSLWRASAAAMISFYFLFVLILAVSKLSAAYYSPFEAFEEPVADFPFVHSPFAPLPHPIAFTNGPIYTSITPSIHPIYHTPRFEIRNIIRTVDKDTAHFSGTSDRSFGFPFYKKL